MDVALAPITDGTPLADPGPDIATGLNYGAIGAYRDLAPGSYAVSVRATGTGSRTPPSLSVRVDIPAGGARTVALSGSFADLSLTVLTDDLSAPGPGSARVRVLAAAAGAPTVDAVQAGGPELARDLPFGSAGRPTTVPAGRTTVHLDGGTGAPADLPLDLPAGSVDTLLLLDGPGGGLTLRTVVDAAGPATVPVGPVAAGSGGTATDDPTTWGWALALAAGSAAALACLRGRRRAVLSLVLALGTVTVPAGAAAPPAVRAAAPAPAVVTASSEAPGVAVPTRLRIPAAGIDAPLAGIGLDAHGLLRPPADLATAGWFGEGPSPGEPGPAVIAGHVDGAHAPAVFFRLREVAPGDPVLITRADGSTVRFTVTRIARYAKAAFPTEEVYGPTPDAQLRLITCGGAFDRSAHSYRDNLVVYGSAVP